MPEVSIDASLDIEVFTQHIAPALNIKLRFVGEEPVDMVTNQYNQILKNNLPKNGIEVVEIPRFQDDNGNIISAKRVRMALKDDDWELLKKLVPSSTASVMEKYRGKI